MIDLPIGKALVAVELIGLRTCDDCVFVFCDEKGIREHDYDCPFPCWKNYRKDGKDVIFKLVDYKEREK